LNEVYTLKTVVEELNNTHRQTSMEYDELKRDYNRVKLNPGVNDLEEENLDL